jgi:putative nucleotidyltransferase-like protein
MPPSVTTRGVQPDWERIPETEWTVYREVMLRAERQGIRFAFGGAFATAVYTGELRNTKDFDFYVLPADRERMKRVMAEAGLTDHFERLAYDRAWIHRASRDDIIVDAIWAMANQRAEVDEGWLNRGPAVTIRGEQLRAIPIEELIWSKLYVLQHERCDWTDVFNLLDAGLESIDWDHLLSRLGEDVPLLAGAVAVFTWLAPDRVPAIPPRIRMQLGVPEPSRVGGADLSQKRANLLDSRPWFTRFVR